MNPYETIDISGDAGIRASGATLPELFINAALGMYSLITDLDGIEEKKGLDISVEGGSGEGLLVSWLNELIFHFDTYGFIGKKMTVHEFTPSDEEFQTGRTFNLRASLAGEEFDPERHEGKLLIKAATYHNLRIEKAGDVWKADVIFDI